MLDIKNNKQAFSLMEVIIAVAVFAMLAGGVFYVVTNSYSNYYGSGDKQVVSDYGQEGIEAVKSIKENSWQAIVDGVGSATGLVKNSDGSWVFSGTEDTQGQLTRTATISNVQRDSTWSIVDSGGVDDPNTKKVEIKVFDEDSVEIYSLVTYMTDWNNKTWEQTDWSGSGDSEFWSNATIASSSHSNIATSTSGEIKLTQAASGVAVSWADWADLVPEFDATYRTWDDFYGHLLGPEGKSLYLTGTSNWDFIKYDISKAPAGIIEPEWKITVPWHTMTVVLHPSGDYAYLGTRDYRNGPTYDWKMVCVANLKTLADINSTTDCYIGTVGADESRYANVMLINEAGTKLYIFDSYGYGHTLDISDGGATLTIVNDSQPLTSGNTEYNYQFNGGYLDESGAEPYIYLTNDDYLNEFMKVGLDGDYFSSTSTNAYVDYSFSTDLTNMVYLGQVSGKNRFLVGSENSTKELRVFEDQGTSLTEIGSYNNATSQSYATVAFDDDTDTGFIYYYDPNGYYSVDLSDMATPIDGGLSHTIDVMNRRSNYRPYDQLKYSTTSRGFFINEHLDEAGSRLEDRVNLHFVGRQMTRATGGQYTYKRTITLGTDSKVVSGPHSDFPVVIAEGSQDYLKTTTHGGKIQHDEGFDIIFTSDSAGDTVLDHEIERYSSSTGELVAWIKVPSLANNTDIYMFYGNSDIVSTQENIAGVWSNDYQSVHHMIDSGKAGTRDSAEPSNAGFKYAKNSPSQITYGKVGPAQSFDGDYDYLTIELNADKEQGYSDFTVEGWVKPNSASIVSYSGIFYFGNGDVADNDGWLFRHYGSTDKVYFHMGDDNVTNLGGMYLQNSAITNDVWTHLAVTVDRDVGYQAYVNNTAQNSYSGTSTENLIGDVYDATIGRDWSSTDYFFMGELDEFRISSTTRSTGWLSTGYNNMNTTSTFYSIGSEAVAGGYDSPGSIYSSIYNIGSSDKDLRSITIEQDIPSGCGLQITLEAADNIAMSGAASQVFDDNSTARYTSTTPASLDGKKYLRYKVYMTNCNTGADTPTLYSVKLDYR